MMTVDIPVTLRQMVEARLDNIERALMSQGMGRADRHQILLALEDQILEMLGQTAGEEPTRDDVLNVLARLDPPEAYLDFSPAEIAETARFNAGGHRREAVRRPSDPAAKKLNVFAVIAFVLTCMAGLGALTWWMLAWFGLIPLSAITIAAGICGTIALCQFSGNHNHQGGLWMAVTATSCAPAVAFLAWVSFLLLDP